MSTKIIQLLLLDRIDNFMPGPHRKNNIIFFIRSPLFIDIKKKSGVGQNPGITNTKIIQQFL